VSDPPSTDHCFAHGVDEPLRPGDYRICFECGHVYRTREDFLAEVAKGCAEAGVPSDPEQPFCPLCTHDF
jgi:hypothetical protein